MTQLDFTNRAVQNQDCDLPKAGGVAIPPLTPFLINSKRHVHSRGWLLLIRCPYCGRQHVHGWGPNQESELQQRVAHCSPPQEYLIFQDGIYQEGGAA